jgi:hypothetical protein
MTGEGGDSTPIGATGAAQLGRGGCHLAMPLPNLQGAGLKTRLARRDAPPVPSQANPLIDQALSIARRPAGMFRSRGSGKILV